MSKKTRDDETAETETPAVEVIQGSPTTTTIAWFTTANDGAQYHAAEIVKHLTQLGREARVVDGDDGVSAVQVVSQ